MLVKKSLWIFAILFSMVLVSAVSPFTPQATETGIVIAYPKYEYVQQNTDFTLHFHAFNSTDYLTNVTTSCILHIYSITGDHIAEENATFDPPYDFEVEVIGNFTNTGTHAYIISCDNGAEVGFASGSFEVLPNGLYLEQTDVILFYGAIIVLTLFLIGSLLCLASWNNYIARFVFYWISHLLIILISFSIWQVSNNYLEGYTGIAGIFKILFYFFTIAVFPMVLVSISWIVYIHTLNDDMKALMNKGFSEAEAWQKASKKKKW